MASADSADNEFRETSPEMNRKHLFMKRCKNKQTNKNVYFLFPEKIIIIKSGWLINLSHYISVFTRLKVRHISPFTWNLLDVVAVLIFFP